MSPAAPLHRTTTVDTLAGALRSRILDGDPEPGASLREQHLAADYAVAPVHRAQAALANAARRRGFAALTDAHEALHHAIVHAAANPRIEAAHAALADELRLFLTRLRPAYDGATLAADHAALLDDLEHGIGPEALRFHIEASTRALVSAMQ